MGGVKTMGVRALDASDAPAYRQLMLDAYARDADAFTSTPEERAAEPVSWWQKRVCDPEGLSQAFGAFHAGELVGGVTIEYYARAKLRHKAHIVGMFVAESHRRLGAGRALLDVALGHALARSGVEVVTLTVTEGNASALRLYTAAGFREFGLEPMAIFTGSEFKSKVHLQLRLTAHANARGGQEDPSAVAPSGNS